MSFYLGWHDHITTHFAKVQYILSLVKALTEEQQEEADVCLIEWGGKNPKTIPQREMALTVKYIKK